MDSLLNLLSSPDGRVLLLGRQVGFFRELGRRFRVPFHRQVVEDESIDVADALLAQFQPDWGKW